MNWRSFFIPIALVLAALIVVLPAFAASAPSWMGSLDGFMLAKARFFQQGLGLGSWNRYWFLGIPGQHIGSPIIPWILASLVAVTGTDPVKVFGLWRSLVALGVVGSVVGVWLFARELFLSTSDPVKSSLRSDHGARVFYLPVFVALFILLMPSVLVLFPQIWNVTSKFGWPAWMLFSPFYLGDGYKTVAFGLVILALLVAWRLIKKWSPRGALVLSFLVAGLLLVDSLSFLTFFLWLVAFLLAAIVLPKKRRASIIVLTGRLLSICFFGFLLVCFWFTPGYIYTFLGSPSFGGRPFTLVVFNLIRRLLVFLPAIFGVIAARRWLRGTPAISVVGLMGVLVFGSLTLAAFFADPDFWQDYSRFGRSLDLSLALLVGGLVSNSNSNSNSKSKSKSKSKRGRWRWMVAIGAVLILGAAFLLQRESLLRGAVDLKKTAEYRVGSELAGRVWEGCSRSEVFLPTEGWDSSTWEVSDCPARVYLSGSSVFWFNGWFNLAQVRGGGEMGSVNDWWPHGSFQIREGSRPELAEGWLEALGVSYLAVHGLESKEVYHDFRFPSKFESMEGWEKVWEEKGDTIFSKSPPSPTHYAEASRVKKASEGYDKREVVPSIARVVDLDILEINAPTKGDDLAALEKYTKMLREEVEFRWMGKRELVTSAELGDGEGIWLAIAYSPFWKVSETSIPIEIKKDPLGMIVVRPKKLGLVSLKLVFDPTVDLIGGALMTIVALYVLLRKPQTIERIAAFAEHLIGRESELDRTAL